MHRLPYAARTSRVEGFHPPPFDRCPRLLHLLQRLPNWLRLTRSNPIGAAPHNGQDSRCNWCFHNTPSSPEDRYCSSDCPPHIDINWSEVFRHYQRGLGRDPPSTQSDLRLRIGSGPDHSTAPGTTILPHCSHPRPARQRTGAPQLRTSPIVCWNCPFSSLRPEVLSLRVLRARSNLAD